MRAAVLYGIGDLRVEHVPDPEPQAGEVVLAIEAALTCGTDVKAFRRGHPAYVKPPGLFGHEFAGRVRSVGAGVSGIAPGQRFFVSNSRACGDCFHCRRGGYALCERLERLFGGFAEALRVPAAFASSALYPIPPAMPAEVAALAEPLACAVKAVRAADVRQTDEVVVLGAGALGLMLCALLDDAGAEVTVVDPHEHRLEFARAFGAKRCLRASKGPPDIDAVRRACNGGRGADQVFEAVGRVDSWELASEMARSGGVVNFFGGCSAESRFNPRTYRVHYEEVRFQGTFHYDPPSVRRALEVLGAGTRPWRELAGPEVPLEELSRVLAGELHPEASKVTIRA